MRMREHSTRMTVRKRWARTALCYVLIGVSTTIAISATSIAINLARPVENPDAVMLRDLRSTSGPLHHYEVAKPGGGTHGPMVQVFQDGLAGVVWFTVSQLDEYAAEELGNGEDGRARRVLRDSAPVVGWGHAGVRVNTAPEYAMCGRLDSIQRDWRWCGVGWPFFSFECEVAQERFVDYGAVMNSARIEPSIRWTKVSGGLLATKSCEPAFESRIAALDKLTPIPMTPIPLGLAANVGFYASAWFILIRGRRGAGEIRGWLRRRRGGCEACGYSLVGLSQPRCPECGLDHAVAGARSLSERRT